MNRCVTVLRSSCTAFLLAAAAISVSAAGIAPLAVDKIPRRSGYDFMGPETRAMQDDEAANPGMLWVLDGEALWGKKAGASDRACFDCHGDARSTMKGVAARFPAFDAGRARPVTLEQRINICRTRQQQATPLAYESKDLLALTAYIGRQSRGLPIEIAIDERTQPFRDAGRETFNRRQGQLNLSCAQCHDGNWGKRLAGNLITQAHPTGYPIYRLEWQGVGSLERRLRNCMFGTRAQALEFGSGELVDLELFLMWRARGMKTETPAVRP
jgi:sulfur-oxidizing protein SoxA